jgi:DNA-binding HxlR family transcriptional regulator
MRRKSFEEMRCPIARGLDLVGEGWSMLILRDALRGKRRFEEFQKGLPITPTTLTRKLDDLVRAGMLERRRYSEHPPRDEYVPTSQGEDFRPVLRALYSWGEKHAPPQKKPGSRR